MKMVSLIQKCDYLYGYFNFTYNGIRTATRTSTEDHNSQIAVI